MKIVWVVQYRAGRARGWFVEMRGINGCRWNTWTEMPGESLIFKTRGEASMAVTTCGVRSACLVRARRVS